MKKNFKTLTLAGTALLATTLAFTACSSSDDVAEATTDTTPYGQGEKVKTQIALNINPNTSVKTRMDAGATQYDGSTFNGITDIHLLTLNDDPSTATTSTDVSLPDAQKDDVNSVTESTGKTYSKRYENVDIDVNTKNMLFYGRSAYSTGSTETKGTLVYDFNGTSKFKDESTGIKITLKSRWTDGGYNSGTTSDKLAKALSKIAGATSTINNVSASAWTATDNLKAALEFFTDNYAGSGNAILNVVQRTWDIASAESTATGASDDTKNAVDAIKKAIDSDSNEDVFSIDNNGKVSYTNSDYAKFPASLNVPEGSPVLKYNAGTFSYDYSGSGEADAEHGIVGLEMNYIDYPAELFYFVNTPLRTSTKKKDTESGFTWPTTVTAWTTDGNWYAENSDAKDFTKNGTVNADTKTIALQNYINYGVALFKTAFRCTTKSLSDNKVTAKKYMSDTEYETYKTTTVNLSDNGQDFPVTGILVGEQPTEIRWNLVGNSVKAEDRPNVIYDSKVQKINADTIYAALNATGYSDYNYTLVLDNWAQQETQGAVNVAVELKNNSGVDFYGVDGKVAKGQKFYLIGTLDLVAAKKATAGVSTKEISWPNEEYYKIAKYGTERVFIQDFATTANFSINKLENAYVTIPDLRSTKLLLGLAVDLNWSQGYTFDTSLGGE